MSLSLTTTLRNLAIGLTLAASGAALHAQTLSGALSDGSGGPITPGVHKVVGLISVGVGQTLTIQAGAILKFDGSQLVLDGTLNVQGTAGSPVIFTSLPDDTAGGDTNGDSNASSPAPGNWQGIVFHAGSAASVLNFADIRYAGAGGWTSVYVTQAGANFTLNHCTIRNSSQPAIQMNNVAAFPTVSNCTFTGNIGAAVDGLPLQSVPGFSSNSASGNTGNYLRVTSASVAAPLSIAATNLLNGALVVIPQVVVAGGASLTFGAGSVVKMAGGAQFSLDGLLFCNGTALAPVVFTSFADDTAAGDTNNDSNTSSPVPGNWQGVTFHGTAAGSVLNFTDIRYAGAGGWTSIYANQPGANFTLSHCTVRDCAQPAVNLVNLPSFPSISNCSFLNNSGVAVDSIDINSVPGFSNNSASGNAGNYMRVTVANVNGPLSIVPANLLNGALVVIPQLNVAAAGALTLAPGCVVKMAGGAQFNLDGTLTCNGTLALPVVITAFADDTAAGDTNNDSNASSPVPGNWQGLTFHTGSSASVLNFTDIRYAGAGGWTGVYVNQNGANFKLNNCTVRNCSQPGMNLVNLSSFPTVSHCTFLNNAGAAVEGMQLASVPGFTLNSASGNAGNYMHVTSAFLVSDLTLVEGNCLNGSLVLGTTINVQPGATLHIQPRVHFKVQGGQINVSGAIDAQGTAAGPIVFTSFADDTVDGDTNNDSNATSPTPGNWQDLHILNTAAASTLNHVRVRYSGAGGWWGVYNQSPLLSAHNVRSDFCGVAGFRFDTAGSSVTDLTAFGCSGSGFEFTAGSFTLLRCTAASNAGAGFTNVGSFTGSVRSSIGWNNAGGNFGTLPAGKVFFSDGSPTLAGSNGNLNVDPLFVNAGAGDLTLQKLSPCVDKGDPAELAFGTDAAGYPRWMDGNLNGVKVVDMGAYEFDHVHLAVTGTATPGGTLTLTTTGTTGLTTWMFIGVVQDEVQLKAFGPLFLNLVAPNLLLSWVPIPSAIPIGIPASLPTPLPIIFQELGILGSTGSDPGNLSDPVYVTIQ